MTDHTSLQMDSWIHSGSVVCPSCSSLCADCSLEGITSEVKSYLHDHDQLIHGWSPKRLSNRSDMIREMEHSKQIKDANRLKCAKKLEEWHLIKIIWYNRNQRFHPGPLWQERGSGKLLWDSPRWRSRKPAPRISQRIWRWIWFGLTRLIYLGWY